MPTNIFHFQISDSDIAFVNRNERPKSTGYALYRADLNQIYSSTHALLEIFRYMTTTRSMVREKKKTHKFEIKSTFGVHFSLTFSNTSSIQKKIKQNTVLRTAFEATDIQVRLTALA